MARYVSGVKDVKRALGKVEDAYGARGLVKAMMQGGFVFERAAKQNIKKQELIDTGELRDTTEARIDPSIKIGIETGPTVVYAAIHEFGGHIPITPRMRRFAWYMHYETKEGMWKGLALTKKTHILVPARPYMRPAFDEKQKRALAAVKKGLVLLLSDSLDKRID